MKQLNILCLGAGVQSTRVFLESCLGETERLDCAIFSDTEDEPRDVYDHLKWLKEMSVEFKIPIHVVSAGNLREDALSGGRSASIPMFTKGKDGKEGRIQRQCTMEYKIIPIEKFIKGELLGLTKRSRWPTKHVVRLWFGISSDEADRQAAPVRKVKRGVVEAVAPIPWKSHYYPLLGHEWYGTIVTKEPNARWVSRSGCHQWMRDHGFPESPRSACKICPHRSNASWAAMKRLRPEEFEEACQFDEAARKVVGIDAECYLHRSLVPLRLAKVDDTSGQKVLFNEDTECDGFHCMSE